MRQDSLVAFDDPRIRFYSNPQRTGLVRQRGVLRVKRLYWRERMDWRARMRMWGEILLLGLPTWLTILLLIRIHYRDRRPDIAEKALTLPVLKQAVTVEA